MDPGVHGVQYIGHSDPTPTGTIGQKLFFQSYFYVDRRLCTKNQLCISNPSYLMQQRVKFIYNIYTLYYIFIIQINAYKKINA